MSNYYISKDKKSGEVVYLEYNQNGYKVSPKIKKKDAIEVNKIVFVSPSLTEKLLKKKINTKISKLLLELNTYYDDDDTSGESRLRNMYKESIRLKENIISKYKEYLKENYINLTLDKVNLIIEGYQRRLKDITNKKEKEFINMLISSMNNENNTKKGKGR